MNYELAKKLKDAGFWDRRESLPAVFIDELFNKKPTEAIRRNLWKPEYFCTPLSELIESCGEDFGTLSRVTKDSKVHWSAMSKDRMVTDGDTPEIAVAKLWLALIT